MTTGFQRLDENQGFRRGTINVIASGNRSMLRDEANAAHVLYLSQDVVRWSRINLMEYQAQHFSEVIIVDSISQSPKKDKVDWAKYGF